MAVTQPSIPTAVLFRLKALWDSHEREVVEAVKSALILRKAATRSVREVALADVLSATNGHDATAVLHALELAEKQLEDPKRKKSSLPVAPKYIPPVAPKFIR